MFNHISPNSMHEYTSTQTHKDTQCPMTYFTLGEAHSHICTHTHLCTPLNLSPLEGGLFFPGLEPEGQLEEKGHKRAADLLSLLSSPLWPGDGIQGFALTVSTSSTTSALCLRAAFQPCLLLSVIKTLTHSCQASKFVFPIASAFFLFLESGVIEKEN